MSVRHRCLQTQVINFHFFLILGPINFVVFIFGSIFRKIFYLGEIFLLKFWVSIQLSRQHVTAEPDFSINGFYRTFTYNYRFSTKKTSKITGKKSEIDKTGSAVTRRLNNYIMIKKFKMIAYIINNNRIQVTTFLYHVCCNYI